MDDKVLVVKDVLKKIKKNLECAIWLVATKTVVVRIIYMHVVIFLIFNSCRQFGRVK